MCYINLNLVVTPSSVQFWWDSYFLPKRRQWFVGRKSKCQLLKSL